VCSSSLVNSGITFTVKGKPSDLPILYALVKLVVLELMAAFSKLEWIIGTVTAIS